MYCAAPARHEHHRLLQKRKGSFCSAAPSLPGTGLVRVSLAPRPQNLRDPGNFNSFLAKLSAEQGHKELYKHLGGVFTDRVKTQLSLCWNTDHVRKGKVKQG